MVVDNNEFRRDSLVSLLGMQSRILVTSVALGAVEALNYLKHGPVDVLVVDMDVPPRGAVDLIRLAHELTIVDETPEVPSVDWAHERKRGLS